MSLERACFAWFVYGIACGILLASSQQQGLIQYALDGMPSAAVLVATIAFRLLLSGQLSSVGTTRVPSYLSGTQIVETAGAIALMVLCAALLALIFAATALFIAFGSASGRVLAEFISRAATLEPSQLTRIRHIIVGLVNVVSAAYLLWKAIG